MTETARNCVLAFFMGVAIAVVLGALLLLVMIKEEPDAAPPTVPASVDCGPVRFDPMWLRIRGIGQTTAALHTLEGIPSIADPSDQSEGPENGNGPRKARRSPTSGR